MFLQEMKFDMALKGTLSSVTPCPLKASQTPEEQIKNASSLIWSDVCFFFFSFPSSRKFFFEVTSFPSHQSISLAKLYYH